MATDANGALIGNHTVRVEWSHHRWCYLTWPCRSRWRPGY